MRGYVRLQHVGGGAAEQVPLLGPLQTTGVHRDQQVGPRACTLGLEARDQLVGGCRLDVDPYARQLGEAAEELLVRIVVPMAVDVDDAGILRGALRPSISGAGGQEGHSHDGTEARYVQPLH